MLCISIEPNRHRNLDSRFKILVYRTICIIISKCPKNEHVSNGHNDYFTCTLLEQESS